ncbi:hypothetical protein V8C42DRAFT_316571 [Trichoderma barbatum]
MEEAAQETERQAAVAAEEYELAVLFAKKAKKGELLRKYEERLNIFLKTAEREDQTTYDTRGQPAVESTLTTRPKDDHLGLATTFSVVSEVVANDKASTVPASIIQSVEHHPKAGKTFMIRTRAEPHYILTLEDGELRLLRKPTLGGGSFWHCVKRSGWYSFRNSVAGTYLSHDGQGQLSVMQSHQKLHEYFHEDGGYILVMKHGDEMWQVAISGGKWLVEQREEGTAWEFIEAKYLCSSITLTYSGLGAELAQ